jgi:hypothetical protein
LEHLVHTAESLKYLQKGLKGLNSTTRHNKVHERTMAWKTAKRKSQNTLGGARIMRAAKIKFQHFGKLHDSTVLFFVIASCTAATKEVVCSTTVLDCPLDVKADTVQVLEFPTEAC